MHMHAHTHTPAHACTHAHTCTCMHICIYSSTSVYACVFDSEKQSLVCTWVFISRRRFGQTWFVFPLHIAIYKCVLPLIKYKLERYKISPLHKYDYNNTISSFELKVCTWVFISRRRQYCSLVKPDLFSSCTSIECRGEPGATFSGPMSRSSGTDMYNCQCVCIYIYINTHTHTHTHKRTYMYVCVSLERPSQDPWVCLQGQICITVNVCVYIYI